MARHLIMLGGATASGKTTLSIAIAKHFDCPIISADSRQFYREISIGTAKPSKEELSEVKHYFINNLSIHETYSVGQYESEAITVLEEIYKNNDIVIAVGGTGMYLKALEQGVDIFPQVDPIVRTEIQLQFDVEGIESLQKELLITDPEYAEIVDLNNPHRIIRALSVIRSCGQKFSKFLTSTNVSRSFTTLKLKTDVPRTILYERINKRVDQMIENGLMEEVQSVYPLRHLNSLNTVGYKELFDHLDGLYELNYAIEKIKQHTRNYAKRQTTWFNNQGNWQGLSDIEPRMIIDTIEKMMNQTSF
jgi:tRNA dimethylallyltransferase